MTIQADGHQAVADLLQDALGDWVDFVFIPSPEVVAIYADHDEYATFYTCNAATLKDLASGLGKSGFEAVRHEKRIFGKQVALNSIRATARLVRLRRARGRLPLRQRHPQRSSFSGGAKDLPRPIIALVAKMKA